MRPYKREKRIHKPVMAREVIASLGFASNAHLKHQARIGAGKKKSTKIIDATVGTGGHSEELVKRGGQIFGIDTDAKMLKIARENLRQACPTPHQNGGRCFTLIHGNFKDIDKSSVSIYGDEFEINSEHGEFQLNCLMMKFDRQELIAELSPGLVELTVTGELDDGRPFEGSDIIRVIVCG